MSARKIDGKQMALQIREGLLPRIEKLKEQGITPGLTVIIVGDDPASKVYVENKRKAAEALGFCGTVIRMDSDCTQKQLFDKIDELNADKSVHGILVQLPLPKQLDSMEVVKRILPEKLF